MLNKLLFFSLTGIEIAVKISKAFPYVNATMVNLIKFIIVVMQNKQTHMHYIGIVVVTILLWRRC